MLYNYIKDHYKEAEPIFFSDLLRENIMEQDLKLHIKEFYEKGLLLQYDAEVYFIPKKTTLKSAIGPNADMVARYRFISKGDNVDGVLEFNLEMQSYDILLYNNVPGGAGHVKRLLNKDAVISSLNAGLDKVSKECCDENTSCYNCLRNYYNQSYHSKLVRKLAKDFIKRILQEVERVNESYQNESWHCNG